MQAGEQLDTSLGRASYQYLVLVEPGRETGRTWALGSRERVVGSLERVSFLGLTGRRASNHVSTEMCNRVTSNCRRPRGNSTVWPLTEYTEQREGLHQRCRGGKRLEGATRAVPGKEELGSEPGCANAGPEMQRGLGLG